MQPGLKYTDLTRKPIQRLSDPEQAQMIKEVSLCYMEGTNDPNKNIKLPGESCRAYGMFQDLQGAGSQPEPDEYEYFQLPEAFNVYDPHHLACIGPGEVFPVSWDREMNEMAIVSPFGLIRRALTKVTIPGGGNSSGEAELQIHGSTPFDVITAHNVILSNIAATQQIIVVYSPGEGGNIPGAGAPHQPSHTASNYSYPPVGTLQGQWEIIASQGFGTGACLLTTESGSPGDVNNQCDYTYTANDPITGNFLAGGIVPHMPPHQCVRRGPGECFAAKAGNYYILPDGTFVLYSFNEKIKTSGCPASIEAGQTGP